MMHLYKAGFNIERGVNQKQARVAPKTEDPQKVWGEISENGPLRDAKELALIQIGIKMTSDNLLFSVISFRCPLFPLPFPCCLPFLLLS